MSSFWTGSRASRPAIRRCRQRGRGHCTERSGLWSFLDRVNTLGVEGEIILDRHDGSVWGLITPHSIDRTLAAEQNAEVAAIPLIRAVGGAIGAVEERHVDVLARNVLDGGIGRFAERQSFSCVGDDPPRDRHHDPSGIAFNRDRMIRAGNFDRLRCGYGVLFHGLTSLCLTVGSAGYPADFPPSTESTWPVIKAALSEARKTMASAISSGFPTRLSGTVETRPAFLSALPVKRLSISVSVGPGATALTRTPEPATSSAADLVSPSTACLLAE